jgi:hypothetical protein
MVKTYFQLYIKLEKSLPKLYITKMQNDNTHHSLMKDRKKYNLRTIMVCTISKRLSQNTSGIILITTCYSIEKKYFENNSIVKIQVLYKTWKRSTKISNTKNTRIIKPITD